MKSILVAGAAVAVAATVAAATVAAAAVAAEPGEGAVPPTYRPVMSDLMNAFIQPRHIKLWLAGKTGSWEYAEYERHNIGGALARMATAIPVYQGAETPGLIAAFATPQLAAVGEAIKNKDQAGFVAAYGALTDACNQCHQATGHGMVVMQVPDAAAYPDQVFTPPQ